MKTLPDVPGSQDPDARPKAALALRAEVEMFLRSGLEHPGAGAGHRREACGGPCARSWCGK